MRTLAAWCGGHRSRYNLGIALADKSTIAVTPYDSRTELCGELGTCEADLKSTPQYMQPGKDLSIGGGREFKRPPGRSWSPQEDEYLTIEWDKGTLARAIGYKLGRSATSVRGRAKILKVPPRYSYPVRFASDPVLRPKHTKRFEQFSDEWFLACNEAFCEAMRANPEERPSGQAILNSVGSSR